MKINKPKFWEKKYNLISFVLLPVSLFLQLIIKIRNKFVHQRSFKIPIICVGNIYLGGTGKTPLVIYIAKKLLKYNKNPAIIKKFYSDHFDERELINKNLDCLFTNRLRHQAIKKAEEKNHDVAILDDGFQDHSVKKDINIICFNSNQLIGNGFTLPAGPLRENINTIKKSQIVLINGEKNKDFEKKIFNISSSIKIFYSKYLLLDKDNFENKNVFAFAGIGNPENFFETLKKNNFKVKKKFIFPDHYEFQKKEIQNLIDDSLKNNLELVTTEKDFLRISKFGFKEVKCIKVKLEIIDEEDFIKFILKYL